MTVSYVRKMFMKSTTGDEQWAEGDPAARSTTDGGKSTRSWSCQTGFCPGINLSSYCEQSPSEATV
jgi:hypothetical protein